MLATIFLSRTMWLPATSAHFWCFLCGVSVLSRNTLEHAQVHTTPHCTAPNAAAQCGVSLDITKNACTWGMCVADLILSVCVKLSKILFKVNLNMPVHRWGNRNDKKPVHTEHTQSNAHFDGPAMTGSGPRSAWACSKSVPQVVYAIHTGVLRRSGVVRTYACSSGFLAYRAFNIGDL